MAPGTMRVIATLALLVALPAVLATLPAESRVAGNIVAKSRKTQRMHALHRAMKLPKGAGITQLEDAEGEDEDEEKLPDNVTVFFAIGFAIMALFAIVFLNMALSFSGIGTRAHGPMMHFLAFFISAISVFTYFSMWSQSGILHVEEDGEDRILFPAWYMDWAITIPAFLIAIGMVGNWAISSLVGTVGSAVMMLGLLWFGAATEGDYRYVFWAGGVFFFGLLAFMLMSEVFKADQKLAGKQATLHAWLNYFAILTWTAIPLMWLLGEAGTRAANLHVEVIITGAADVLSKVLLTLLLVGASTAATKGLGDSPIRPTRSLTSSTYV